jgi:hypothetical protein
VELALPRVGDPEDLGNVVRKLAELLLAFAQRALGGLPRADVLHDRDEILHLAGGVADEGSDDGNPDGAAVLANIAFFGGDFRRCAGEEQRLAAAPCGAALFGRGLERPETAHLLDGIAQHVRELAVDANVLVVEAGERHADAGVLEHAAKIVTRRHCTIHEPPFPCRKPVRREIPRASFCCPARQSL